MLSKVFGNADIAMRSLDITSEKGILDIGSQGPELPTLSISLTWSSTLA